MQLELNEANDKVNRTCLNRTFDRKYFSRSTILCLIMVQPHIQRNPLLLLFLVSLKPKKSKKMSFMLIKRQRYYILNPTLILKFSKNDENASKVVKKKSKHSSSRVNDLIRKPAARKLSLDEIEDTPIV